MDHHFPADFTLFFLHVHFLLCLRVPPGIITLQDIYMFTNKLIKEEDGPSDVKLIEINKKNTSSYIYLKQPK